MIAYRSLGAKKERNRIEKNNQKKLKGIDGLQIKLDMKIKQILVLKENLSDYSFCLLDEIIKNVEADKQQLKKLKMNNKLMPRSVQYALDNFHLVESANCNIDALENILKQLKLPCFKSRWFIIRGMKK